MRFIVDESTGMAVVDYLCSAGHDVLAVAATMPGAADADILARAITERRILITNDKDFGELIFRTGKAHPGILLLRLRRERSQPRARGEGGPGSARRSAGRFVYSSDGKQRPDPACRRSVLIGPWSALVSQNTARTAWPAIAHAVPCFLASPLPVTTSFIR